MQSPVAADGRAQTEEDLKLSADLWKTIGTYMQAKYDADKDLAFLGCGEISYAIRTSH